jgi:hypothetical protein
VLVEGADDVVVGAAVLDAGIGKCRAGEGGAHLHAPAAGERAAVDGIACGTSDAPQREVDLGVAFRRDEA